MLEKKIDNFIRAHLNVNWLRPESALWNAIASSKIAKYEIASPSLDLGCGNGISSFLTAGGEFSVDYDRYINTDTTGFWDNKDIYNVCKHVDLKGYVIEQPQYTFTFGLDHKDSLIAQAKALNFYDDLIKSDANGQLPFEDETFKTIFSNILYWLADPLKALQQVYRILNKRGIAILCIPNNKFIDYCVTYRWKETNSELLRLLNRGRTEDMHWTMSYNDFAALAKSAGFSVLEHSYYLSPLTLKIWDIGMRPLSSPLIKMCNGLSIEDRRAIKTEWIETVIKFLHPLYEMDDESKDEGGFHLFILGK